MDIQDTSCCAVREISELQEHDSPKEAMLEFCERHSSSNYYWDSYYNDRDNDDRETLRNTLHSIYLFSGVERIRKGAHKDCLTGYGSKFAAFIKANKLGAVTKGPTRPNYLNHPTHFVAVWTWAPNRTALERWYNANKEQD